MVIDLSLRDYLNVRTLAVVVAVSAAPSSAHAFWPAIGNGVLSFLARPTVTAAFGFGSRVLSSETLSGQIARGLGMPGTRGRGDSTATREAVRVVGDQGPVLLESIFLDPDGAFQTSVDQKVSQGRIARQVRRDEAIREAGREANETIGPLMNDYDMADSPSAPPSPPPAEELPWGDTSFAP